MSDYIYENRQLALWAEYKDLNGHLSHDAFMERHPKVNAYIVNLMRKFDGVSKIDRAAWTQGTPAADDYADAYASREGGI